MIGNDPLPTALALIACAMGDNNPEANCRHRDAIEEALGPWRQGKQSDALTRGLKAAVARGKAMRRAREGALARPDAREVSGQRNGGAR